jgi:hypothetical protein
MNNISNTKPVTSLALTGSDQAVATAQVFYGMVITNESGSAMNLHVHNGASNSGTPIICGAYVANNQSTNIWFGPNGIACSAGIYVDVVSGTPTGSVLYR